MSTEAEALLALKYKDEEALLEELGTRLSAIRRFPSRAATYNLTVSEDDLTRLTKKELHELGQRVFHTWNRELYRFVCSDAKQDSADRDKLRSAILGANATGAAIVTGFLVGTLGVSPAIAVVIASILMRVIVVPTGRTLCEFWKERLPESESYTQLRIPWMNTVSCLRERLPSFRPVL